MDWQHPNNQKNLSQNDGSWSDPAMSNPATALAVPVPSGIMGHSIHGVRAPKIFSIIGTAGTAPVPHEAMSFFISENTH